MSFKFDNRGLNKFMKNLETAANNLSGEISFDVLFDSSFMKNYTKYSSFEELLTAGGFVVNSQEDFQAILEDEFDTHIRNSTSFSSWENMKTEAGKLYIKNNLKL